MKGIKPAIKRAIPIAIALSPIGFLFGILAAQADWGVFGVLLLSVIGFTGSGQFTYLTFYNQGIEQIGYITVFLILLSINLRYIPMTISASNPMPISKWRKAFFAHYLSDESYSCEKIEDNWQARASIRMCIGGIWIISTVLGYLLQQYIPLSVQNILNGLTFPISIILVLLSYANIMRFISHHANWRSTLSVGACLVIGALAIMLLGVKYFWLPSIAISYLLLCHFAPKKEATKQSPSS